MRARFAALVRRFPVFATYLGLAEHDHRLSDGSRAALEQDIVDARRFLSDVETLDPASLSPANQVERDLALFATRRQIFDDEVHRVWERRVSAMDELGDGMFLLLARGSRPLAQRLAAIGSRLEAAPRLMEEHRTRLGERPVHLWNELELDAAQSMPALFAEVIAAAGDEFGDGHAEQRRIKRAARAASRALDDYCAWIREQLSRADDDFALGPERYEELIRLRAFDGLSSDDILQIGYDQLDENRRARRRVAAEIDAEASEREVLDRVKSDHPADFAGALEAYRRAMAEARQFVVDHDIASMPPAESLAVSATPAYLRNVLPFAAYFSPARFDPRSSGIYVVTPSIGDEPRALREHNYAAIYNTSIHEAYPGHHQQLTAALAHPSLVRLLVEAPEFIEGWAMYCEQMMREEGFSTSPKHLLAMYTDAIWRACRIILDVRLHRRETGLEDGVRFLAEQTGMATTNATVEVNRYSYTPTYQLSYLLGKTLLLRLRSDERARLGARFSLKAFHDALLREGNLPISIHRRLLQNSVEAAEASAS
ncbi:MAG: DUF885 domain-containing protein [Chloroflexota bacterium]|nr:DUF885 domain-containing protein [Chloroflexota bacterium]